VPNFRGTIDYAFAIKHQAKKGSYKSTSAAAFCTHHRLNRTRTRLFENPEIDDKRVMRLDLTRAVEVGRGSR